MARASLEDEYPQITRPVGSSEEVLALGVPLRNVSTCCQRDSQRQYGCPMYERCDRSFRDTRPHNEIYREVKRNGLIRVTHGACFEVVKKEVERDLNGGYVEVIGGEGESYDGKGSVRRHPVRDPNCNDCAKGECYAHDDRSDIEFDCPVFPAAAEHPELKRFAEVKRARESGLIRRKESIKQARLGPEPESKVRRVKGEGAAANG